MAHGYLGDGFGTHGEIEPGSGNDRDRDRRDRDRRERGWSDRDWRDRDQHEHSSRQDQHWRDRDRDQDRGMMFGNSGGWQWEEDRWNDGRWSGQDFIARYSGPERRGSYSANPDDHYRSWRDRHMSELDRDYEDYCREREEQFHSDFDAWRRQKYGNPQPLRTGMTQSGLSHDPTGETQAAEDMAPGSENSPTPTEAATLGTNSGRPRNRG